MTDERVDRTCTAVAPISRIPGGDVSVEDGGNTATGYGSDSGRTGRLTNTVGGRP